MEFYRTAENCFQTLKDYNFKFHDINVRGLRMHYVDEGPNSANPILLLHGHICTATLFPSVQQPEIR